MGVQQRKLSFLNRLLFKIGSKNLLVLAVFFLSSASKGQIVNYVSNGSFEEIWSCTFPNDILLPKNWRTIDSTSDNSRLYSTCPTIQNVPIEGGQMQLPRTGNNFIGIIGACLNNGCTIYSRTYARNRLKSPLISGKTYCAKFFVNQRNISTIAIDAIGMCFTNSNSLDTIQNIFRPLTFLNPQVQNPQNNLLIDTLNWIIIQGTFVANGNETNLLIGNFLSDINTNTIQVNPGTILASDLFIDDVSCIPLDLPAYAYSSNNAYAIPGNTLYLGRQHDVGIDEACMWYKLPNTTNAIDTAAGIIITVAATTETYMVKQDICGVIKYDTVVVHPSALGNGELRMLNEQLSLAPNPASDEVEIKIENAELRKRITSVVISNSLGEIIAEENFKDAEKIKLDISYLKEGIYFLALSDSKGQRLTKKLVIAR